MLDDRKHLAIQHLDQGEDTKTDIAKNLSVALQILYDWMDDPIFKQSWTDGNNSAKF